MWLIVPFRNLHTLHRDFQWNWTLLCGFISVASFHYPSIIASVTIDPTRFPQSFPSTPKPTTSWSALFQHWSYLIGGLASSVWAFTYLQGRGELTLYILSWPFSFWARWCRLQWTVLLARARNINSWIMKAAVNHREQLLNLNHSAITRNRCHWFLHSASFFLLLLSFLLSFFLPCCFFSKFNEDSFEWFAETLIIDGNLHGNFSGVLG